MREPGQRALHQTLSLLEATLEATLETTVDGILIVDSTGRVTAFNERLLQLWRLTPELARQGNDDALLATAASQLDDPESFLAEVHALYRDPERESFDRLTFKDGRVFERYSRPQRQDGKPVGRVWSFRDVTEREELLRQALFLSDASRLLANLDVEKALTAVARLSIEGASAGCAVDLLDGPSPGRLVAVSRPGSPLPPDEIHPTALSGHGVLFTLGALSCAAVPLLVRGRVAGVFTFTAVKGFFTRRELECFGALASRAALALENARLYQRATEAIHARDEFLAMAAHELRGPLTGIRLAIEALTRSGAREDGTRAAREIVLRESQQLSRFITELLDFGAIRTNCISFVLTPVDLGSLVRQAVDALAAEAARSGSSLTVTSSGDTAGTWDAGRVRQVVQELLRNALKFGRGRPVSTRVAGADDTVMLEVEDKGIGIPPEDAERIFDPFERAVSSRNYGGLGLGLFIARTNVEGMRGRMGVRSAPGLGSTFWVELPRRVDVEG